MNLIQKVILSLLFSVAAQANTIGFSGGSEMTVDTMEGSVQVRCQEGPYSDYAFFTCRENTLVPYDLSYFYGPEGLDADKVIITANHEDGSDRKKSEKYDAKKLRTQSRINLAVGSMTQRPLLERGVNRIDYQFQKKSQPILTGSYEIRVNRGQIRNCRPASYTSRSLQDCRNSSNVCQHYFNQNNFCN